MKGDVNRPECALLDTWLDDWNAGRVPDILARRLDAHVAACERCARLVAIVRDAEAPADDERLLARVLDRTTGSPCGRAESLLPDLVDESLDAGSREILQDHLAHCAGCSQLLAALREARRVLPALAAVEPPPGFAAAVLRATTFAPSPGARARRAPGRAAAFGQWWLRILARPRASLELAYVATILLVVAFGNPVAAFHQAEQRAGRLAEAVPVGRLAGDLAVKKAATGTVERLLAPFVSAARAIATEVSARWRQAQALLDQVTARVGDAINWLATIDLRGVFGAERAPARGQPDTSHQPRGAQPAGNRK